MTTPWAWWPPLALLLAATQAMAQAQAEPSAETGEWNFNVTLDGRAIGTHRFVVSGSGARREVDSRAQFDVRMLGIPVYRYRHQAQEQWQGDCLRALRANTDDDGQPSRVERRFDGECRMGFAYWNPRMVTQQQLVNPQTGRTEPVRVQRLPDASVQVQGQAVAAQGWRLQTDDQRITVWYATAGGRWVGLDAQVRGERQLSYRLPAASTATALNTPAPGATPP